MSNSKINYYVPPRNFEYVRDRIAEILAEEVEWQGLNYNTELDSITVYNERTQQFDKGELPAINVSLAVGNYDNKHAGKQDGTYQYNIDVYVNCKTTGSDKAEKGDVIAGKFVQRILGFCYYVLNDPAYKTLGFAPGFIGQINYVGLNIAVPDPKDTMNMKMGRLTFSVRAGEFNTLETPKLLDGYQTTVQLDESTRGYFWEGN